MAAHVEAKDALVALGWRRPTASAAVEQAIAEHGNAPLEEIIRSALRNCWKPETYAPS
jgi:Holliday junction resolvasome RuvABC DNA-binding subunit